MAKEGILLMQLGEILGQIEVGELNDGQLLLLHDAMTNGCVECFLELHKRGISPSEIHN